MTITVNIHEAKTQMSKLARAVEAGDTVIVSRAGVPVMQWRAVVPQRPRFGAIPGFGGPNWEDAFNDEADAEVRGAFDKDLGLDAPA